MRCLITGASGHLGSFLTRRLLAAGAHVAVLARPQSDLWRLAGVLDQVELVRADMSDVDGLAKAFTAMKPEIVFHLAWHGVSSGYRNDLQQVTRNVADSLAVVEHAHLAGCSCWVGVGSQAEYGRHEGILTEEVPPRPVTAYGVAKLCVGLLAQQAGILTGMRSIWLRLLASYGPADDERRLIPTTIRQLLARQVPALTSGDQRWDYLYVEDAAEVLYRVAVTRTAEGVYNLGSGEAYTIREIVERVRDLIDPSLSLGFNALPPRPDQAMHVQADISRLRVVTGWTPETGLDEGLRRTVDWYCRRWVG